MAREIAWGFKRCKDGSIAINVEVAGRDGLAGGVQLIWKNS
jgi:hypothetical protein